MIKLTVGLGGNETEYVAQRVPTGGLPKSWISQQQARTHTHTHTVFKNTLYVLRMFKSCEISCRTWISRVSIKMERLNIEPSFPQSNSQAALCRGCCPLSLVPGPPGCCCFHYHLSSNT